MARQESRNSSSGYDQPSIDEQFRCCDEAGIVGCKVRHCAATSLGSPMRCSGMRLTRPDGSPPSSPWHEGQDGSSWPDAVTASRAMHGDSLREIGQDCLAGSVADRLRKDEGRRVRRDVDDRSAAACTESRLASPRACSLARRSAFSVRHWLPVRIKQCAIGIHSCCVAPSSRAVLWPQ